MASFRLHLKMTFVKILISNLHYGKSLGRVEVLNTKLFRCLVFNSSSEVSISERIPVFIFLGSFLNPQLIFVLLLFPDYKNRICLFPDYKIWICDSPILISSHGNTSTVGDPKNLRNSMDSTIIRMHF